MELDEARAFLRDNHRAVMHTYRADGTPQLSPVVTTVADDGFAVVSTRTNSMKVANVARDPRASLCVISDAFFGPWVRVDGVARIVHLPQAMEGLVDYYRRVAGEHPDWDDYRRAMTREHRVLLRVALTAAGPDRSG